MTDQLRKVPGKDSATAFLSNYNSLGNSTLIILYMLQLVNCDMIEAANHVESELSAVITMASYQILALLYREVHR